MRFLNELTARRAMTVAAATLLGARLLSAQPPQAPPPVAPDDPVAKLVRQLDLDRYKATIKELTRFGDRRQGTERNRKALDWIEAQLRSYGCTNTERMTYEFTQPTPRPTSPGRAPHRRLGLRPR